MQTNNFGKKILVENCKKVRINDLLKGYRIKFKKIFLRSEIETIGLNIELITSKTKYNGIRFWFACPICKNRVGIIYQHPLNQMIGCRRCLNLDYRNHQNKRYPKL
jgi:hypothetical protein